MLKPGQLMLEYVMAEPRSYCLVISRNHVRIVPLAGRNTIEKLIAAYLKTLKNEEYRKRKASNCTPLC